MQEKVNPQNITNTYTEDILNSILPPREYTTEKQQLWYTPALIQDPVCVGYTRHQARCPWSTRKTW